MKAKLRLAAAAIATTLVLAACGSSGDSDTATPTSQTGAETTGPIVIGSTNEPTSLQRNVGGSSGISETTTRNVYEGLTSIDDSGEVINTLARDVEVSDDGLTYTFTLQDGVTFHDGTPLTSKDAAWSVSEIISETSQAARANDLRVITDIATPDDATLVLTLDRPTQSLLFFLASVTIVKDGDTENTSDNGTGPYQLEEWVQGSHMTLVRNDSYWGEPAQADEVTFQFYEDETAMNNALLTGQLDLVIQQSNPDQLAQFDGNDNFVITEGNSIKKFVWTFNNKEEPFTDVRVRQALYKAIDREAILSAVWGDYGQVIGSMPPVSEPWYDESFADIHAYDPDAATALLTDAGVTDLSFDISYVARDTNEIIVQQIKSDLAAIGVTLNLKPIDDAQWYESVYTNKDYQSTLMDHNNPRDVLWYANPEFYWQYDNKDVQALKVAADEATSEEEQVEAIHSLSAIIAEEAPSAWLFMAPQIRIATTDITGFPADKNAEPFYVGQITRTN
ncbi:ABC transporter substrate-binding protein [Jonesia denitrificans]|uniref:Extracellular solute-binding protein family 5 n=1 Tax=Jonesia denitrificans (strain ATCC 14870 / DSM 20603 / BCRC 15368 / CIP 55.134 / JCM 11481 / NBRC 15587 / NCTC 10816 / Prevot 55134) TaxID=471856 RepID=C7R017_JONDD|nr:ABC transporter substrate-binding protein [Jonesia denitrificans]ACV09575.1 extracellular solute-binding protein family 5 [Jonesia denitrificans DSM 20603]ASE09198.1 ABC transporter substrate-binding protein [Jonesia denitrificans]QXB43741.1 ABC transporter substrate-binding protein [Jonesia denitrificans]SQH22006.1 Stage 0 sporulation protein KA [Jonesia denitrificans]